MSELASSTRTAGRTGDDRALGRSTGEFGVIVFLASDVMLFAPFFAAYFLLRANNVPWPPGDVELDVPRAAAATLVLFASSFTMHAADQAQHRPDGAATVRRWLLVTMLFGAVFLANQLAEFATLSFGADSHPYGSVFWGLTGLHGAHVTAGICAIGALFVRSVRSPTRASAVPWSGGVSLFWHLVDAIWIAVFVTIWVAQ